MQNSSKTLIPEKADPGAGGSPERGAEGGGGGSLQVVLGSPLPLLLQAPLYVPLLGTRH